MWLLPTEPKPPSEPRDRSAPEALVVFRERSAYVHRPGASELVRSVVLPAGAQAVAAAYSAPVRRLLVLYRMPTRYGLARLRLSQDGRVSASLSTLPRSNRRYSDLAADPKRPFVYLAAIGRGITSYVLGEVGLRSESTGDAAPGPGRLVLSPDGRTALLLQNDSFMEHQDGTVTSYHRDLAASPRFRMRSRIGMQGLGTAGGAFTPDGRRAYVVAWYRGWLALGVDASGKVRVRRRSGGAAHSGFAYDPVSATFFAGTGPANTYGRVGRFSVRDPDAPRLAGETRLFSGERTATGLLVSSRNRTLYEIHGGIRAVQIGRDGAPGRPVRFFAIGPEVAAPALVPLPSQ